MKLFYDIRTTGGEKRKPLRPALQFAILVAFSAAMGFLTAYVLMAEGAL